MFFLYWCKFLHSNRQDLEILKIRTKDGILLVNLDSKGKQNKQNLDLVVGGKNVLGRGFMNGTQTHKNEEEVQYKNKVKHSI